MKTYTLKLKGSKKQNTQDLIIKVKANNKGHAFSLAYYFFQRGEYQTSYELYNGDTWRLEDHIEGLANLMHLKGKYKVYSTSIVGIG